MTGCKSTPPSPSTPRSVSAVTHFAVSARLTLWRGLRAECARETHKHGLVLWVQVVGVLVDPSCSGSGMPGQLHVDACTASNSNSRSSKGRGKGKAGQRGDKEAPKFSDAELKSQACSCSCQTFSEVRLVVWCFGRNGLTVPISALARTGSGSAGAAGELPERGCVPSLPACFVCPAWCSVPCMVVFEQSTQRCAAVRALAAYAISGLGGGAGSARDEISIGPPCGLLYLFGTSVRTILHYWSTKKIGCGTWLSTAAA